MEEQTKKKISSYFKTKGKCYHEGRKKYDESLVEVLNISFQKSNRILTKEVIIELVVKGCLSEKAEKRSFLKEKKHPCNDTELLLSIVW